MKFAKKNLKAWLDEQMTREQTHLEPYMDFLGSRNEQDINVNGATLLPDGTRALTEALAVKPGK